MMKHGWLALLLIMPTLGGAEVVTESGSVVQAEAPVAVAPQEGPATVVPETTAGSVTEPAAEAPAAAAPATEPRPRPTLVEKLKAQEAASPRSAAPAWSNMIVGLFTVLGLIMGMAWLARKLRARVPGFAGQLNVVESTALGPRERLCIVEVDGKRLLLGVTQQSITVLQTSDCETRKDESESMFSEKIKKMLQNGTPNGR